MLKSKGVTHIVNLAGGDLSLGAPHIDISVYEGKHILIFLCLTLHYLKFCGLLLKCWQDVLGLIKSVHICILVTKISFWLN